MSKDVSNLPKPNRWNSYDCFEKIIKELETTPIYYRDSENLSGEVFIKELFQNSDIDPEDGTDYIVDLIAYIIKKNGYIISN